MNLIVLLIIVLLIVGAAPVWPHSANWGYYPAGGLVSVLILMIVLRMLGFI